MVVDWKGRDIGSLFKFQFNFLYCQANSIQIASCDFKEDRTNKQTMDGWMDKKKDENLLLKFQSNFLFCVGNLNLMI